MDELDNILTNIDLEEEKLDVEENEEWYCDGPDGCEHGPMNEKEDKCTRCGARSGKIYNNDHDGWEEEDEMEGIEEINYDY